MTTTVTKTIGPSGCDYTTIQAWFDACPANITAGGVDQIWRGECKNISEFTSTDVLLNATGKTTDATHYIELTTYSGASFRDNASVQSNALRYNASNGAAIRMSGSYVAKACIQGSGTYLRVSNLQFKSDDPSAIGFDFASMNVIIDNCIFHGSRGGFSWIAQFNEGLASTVRNSVFINEYGASTAYVAKVGISNFYNCTFVTPSDKTASVSIYAAVSSGAILKNCAFFGATGVDDGGSRANYTTCYTDASSPPTGCTTTTFSSAFENTALATLDLRLKSGSALIDAGTTDSTNAATDIAGTSRTVGSYDVGAWEYFSASTPQLLRPSSIINSGNWTASSGTLATAIDETAYDDADYDTTTNLSSDTMEIKFSAGGDPAVGTGHKVRYRIKGSGGAGIVVSLYQGTTLIAGPWTHDPADGSFTTYEQTLSSGEANSITDYTDLRLRFVSST